MTEVHNRIRKYGEKIDKLLDLHDYNSLYECLGKIKIFAKQNEEAGCDATIFYILGTGYAEYSNYIVRSGQKHTDTEVINLRRLSMYYYRKSISLLENSDYSNCDLELRLLTNYANVLDASGRVIEALKMYRRVLQLDGSFSMGIGNYGRAIQFLANMVNDEGHYNDLHCYAYQTLKKALNIKSKEMHEQAEAVFSRIVDEYEDISNKNILNEPVSYKKYSLGCAEEAKYRKWCLKNHLFLNPLNEMIEERSAFAHDPLTITTLKEDIECTDSVNGNPAEPPKWFAMLNQLKEEYVYARFVCYEGMKKYKKAHFADKGVKLSLASYDYTNYSIRIEHLKSAFKTLYSMLDQICFFVNDFWQLGLKEREADAYHVCKSNNYPKDNVVLHSLYWVLSEFYEKYGESEEKVEKELKDLRNAIEHKFIKIHEYGWNRKLCLESDGCYHVSEDEFKKYIMRLLELARESLIYLVYAVGVNESKKKKTEKTISMQICDFSDEWKL